MYSITKHWNVEYPKEHNQEFCLWANVYQQRVTITLHDTVVSV